MNIIEPKPSFINNLMQKMANYYNCNINQIKFVSPSDKNPGGKSI